MVVANTFATDTRVRREARSLAGHGFDVQVLCWDRQGHRPATERVDGCLVHNFRLGKTTALVSSKIYYLMAAVLFQAVAFLFVMKQIGLTRSLLLHAHDFNTLLGCVAARQLLAGRVRLVYDSHELTPGAYKEWYGSLVARIVRQLELSAIRRVDGIVTANEAIHQYLNRNSSAPASVIYNCPATDEIPRITPADAKMKLGLSGRFVVLFSGRVRQDYNMDMVLDAARELKRLGLSDIGFVFVGPLETMTYLMNQIANERLENVFEFRGWVNTEELFLYYTASDVCFAVTRDLGDNTRVLTPIKLFESMACGVPVVVRPGTLSANIVSRWGCGRIVNNEPGAFLRELVELYRNREESLALAEAGRRAFALQFNWDLMQDKLFQLYAQLGFPSERI